MKRLTALTLLAVALVGGAATMKPSIVRDKPALAQLLWNNEEAFLFIGQIRIGWRMSYLMLALSTLSAFGAPAQDARRSMAVIRITPAAVERQQIDGMLPPELGVAEGRLSTVGGIWWTGERFAGERHTVPPEWSREWPQEFTDLDGWTKRSFGFFGDRTFDIVLSGRTIPVILTIDGATEAIDLDRGGGTRERIWSANTASQWLSRSGYDAIFRH